MSADPAFWEMFWRAGAAPELLVVGGWSFAAIAAFMACYHLFFYIAEWLFGGRH